MLKHVQKNVKKYIDGCEIKNIANLVIPYGVSGVFSIVSYNDKLTLNLTYREKNLIDSKRFRQCIDAIYEDFKTDIPNI